MSTSNDEVYRQLIALQQTIYENHKQVRDELDNLKVCFYKELGAVKQDIHQRISPVEEKVTQHDHTFNLTGKLLTWIGVPSGAGLIGFICWVVNLFQTPHK